MWARENIRDIDLVYLIEKYENNIEFALAILTGKNLAVKKYFQNGMRKLFTSMCLPKQLNN